MKASTEQDYHERIVRTLVHGESPKEHILRLRLERAARDLKRTGEPITQLALEAGFETHESFTRAFGEMFGVSPSVYRTSSGDGEPPRVAVKEVPVMRVLFLRHVGPYAEVGATWGRLMAWAGMRVLLGPGMRLIGIVHDDPDVTPPDKVRGSYAVLLHKGPYQGLGRAYQRLYGGWLPQSGYSLRDAPAFEQYLNSPRDTRPEDLLTLIHVPLDS